jgi:biopolymer transport protein ExbD
MKNKFAKDLLGSAKKYPWRTSIGVVVLTLLVVGMVTAITSNEVPSLKAQDPQSAKGQADEKGSASASKRRNYVTSNASGQMVVLDRQTGQSRPMTPTEARNLADGLKQLINQSTDGLVEVHRSNGMVEMDLQGHFQNVLLAKKESDGTVSQACVDNLESAADFFEIDPVLLGLSPNGSRGQTSTSRVTDR